MTHNMKVWSICSDEMGTKVLNTDVKWGVQRDVDYVGFLQETYLGKYRDHPLYYTLKSIRHPSTKSSFAIQSSKGIHVHTWDLVLDIVVMPNIHQKLIKLIHHQFSSIKAYIETCPHDNWSNYNIGILLE